MKIKGNFASNCIEMDAEKKKLKRDMLKSFNAADAFKKHDDDDKSYVILVNGKRVVLTTGKNVWANLGAAKNSMRNHLRVLFWKFRSDNKRFYNMLDQNFKSNYGIFKLKMKELEDEWISKHVSYVPISKYLVTANKINKKKDSK